MLRHHVAGVPKGLVNLITGRGSQIGDYLTTHPGCRCISFTGGDTGLDIASKVWQGRRSYVHLLKFVV